MFQTPQSEHRLFQAAIYNSAVREMVKDNRSHPFFDDKWADVFIFEVSARSESDAREMLARRYPSELGFVMEVVIPARLAAAA